MAYFQNIVKELAEKVGVSPFSELHVVNGSYCVLSGHKGLYSISEEEVVVRRRGGRLSVRGAGLRVSAADGGEIVIAGKILSVTYLEDENG